MNLNAFVDIGGVHFEAFGAGVAVEEVAFGYIAGGAIFEPVNEDGGGIAVFEFGEARGVKVLNAIGIFRSDIVQRAVGREDAVFGVGMPFEIAVLIEDGKIAALKMPHHFAARHA